MYVFILEDSSIEKPIERKTSSLTDLSTTLHKGHILLANRCAIIKVTDDEIRYGSTPIFNKRVMVLTESLVCSVLNTKWPVNAAFTAISTVSLSRISPTRMTSGSCRKNERKEAAKVKPIFSLTFTCATPSKLYSIGSSAVRILISSRLILCKAAYCVVVLPEPVGPVTNTIPCGASIALFTFFRSLASKPNESIDIDIAPLSKIRITTLSPLLVGNTEIRRSMLVFFALKIIAPS